ncbi:unnamed protein product [Prunus armeniaca]|uniref:Uncharacterized protein n=1 Tax=Prunus armeniaca TaxID=36596 RepID=A0A6J5VNS9_PRUAR|nr:unnamed protein product [Prunus armeniaca]
MSAHRTIKVSGHDGLRWVAEACAARTLCEHPRSAEGRVGQKFQLDKLRSYVGSPPGTNPNSRLQWTNNREKGCWLIKCVCPG